MIVTGVYGVVVVVGVHFDTESFFFEIHYIYNVYI